MFGSDVDLSIYSPLGAFIRLIAFTLSQNWDALEGNFYSSYVDTADGVDLDRLGRFAGIPRKNAQSEKVVLNFTGAEYTSIPVGFLVQSASGILYRTIESKSITAGVANVQSESDLVGTASRVTSGQLTEIVTPLAGIDSVTNALSSSGGSLVESDGDYRARILDSVGFIKNSGAVNYIKLKLEEQDYIQSVYIAENDKPLEYGGLPANSLAFTVLGGTDQQIAELIYNYKPAGVRTFGDTMFEINFSRPSYLDIYVDVEVETMGGWSADNIALIKTAIVKYIGGVDTVEGEDTEYKGIGIGEDIVAWKSYSNIVGIPGIKNLNIKFGTSPSPITLTGIAVPPNQIAKTQTSWIEVSVV